MSTSSHPFRIEIVADLDGPAGATWDELTRCASIFMRRPYLTALRQTIPEGFGLHSALIHSGATAVAAVLGQTFPFNLGALIHPDEERVALRKRDRAVVAVGRKALLARESAVVLCGNLFSWGLDGVAFAPGADARALWPAVADCLELFRKAAGLRSMRTVLAIKEVPGEISADLAGIAEVGFRPLELEPDMVLSIPPEWRSLADYHQALNSKYRKSAVKIVKDVEAAGFGPEVVPDPAALSETLHGLYLQVWARAKVQGASLSPAYVPQLAAQLGDDFRCVVLRAPGQLPVGFVTLIRDSDTAVGYICGFDYEVNRETPIYLRLLQAAIAEGINLGCRRISFGSTALEPKSRLGARPVTNHAWMKHRFRLLGSVLKRLIPLARHEDAPVREPFR
jgi:hypothetical protein